MANTTPGQDLPIATSLTEATGNFPDATLTGEQGRRLLELTSALRSGKPSRNRIRTMSFLRALEQVYDGQRTLAAAVRIAYILKGTSRDPLERNALDRVRNYVHGTNLLALERQRLAMGYTLDLGRGCGRDTFTLALTMQACLDEV